MEYVKDSKMYYVVCDKEKLTLLKDEIIDKCSEIVHREYISNHGPNEGDSKRIRNFKKESINDKFLYEPVFHFSYDEYIIPI